MASIETRAGHFGAVDERGVGRGTVELIFVIIATIVTPRLEIITVGSVVDAVVEHQKRGLQVVGFGRAKRTGVKLTPSEKLILITREKIRLRHVVGQLDAGVVARELVVSEWPRAFGLRVGHRRVGRKRATRDFPGAHIT